MFYKWLVQITVCLNWFNPFVYLMCKQITKACEFPCDVVVLSKVGYQNAQDYGKTLLDAMVSVGRYKESLGVLFIGIYPVNAVSYQEESVESNETAVLATDEQGRFRQTGKGSDLGISSPGVEQCYEAEVAAALNYIFLTRRR